MHPIVSVIIALFNRKELIKFTLDSLTPTLHPSVDLEVLVVDDGSTDGSADWVRQCYPWVRVLCQPNSGAPTARNFGLKESTGEYILFLDSDDLIEPNFFEKKLYVLDNHPSIVAAYGPWEHFEETSDGAKRTIPRHTNYPIIESAENQTHLENLLGGWYIVCHALLWRKSELVKIGGFNTSLIVNQDVDLLFNSLVANGPLQGVHSPKALYRSHQEMNRVGTMSKIKLKSILDLRKDFIQRLIFNGKFNHQNKHVLATFCFDTWASYLNTNPEVAEQFYQLSKTLNPNLTVKGGKLFKIIGYLIGSKNAVILKGYFKRSN